ncbi:hypothetical protein BH24CHL8_BH24CHL8_11780 [soil metagenome]
MDPSTDPETVSPPTATTPPAPEPTTTMAEEPEGEPATFTPEYVRGLRREAADRRRAAKEADERVAAQEAELGELRAWRLDRAIVDANATRMGVPLLTDASDLLAYTDAAELVDDAGRADPARIAAAIAALLERKPHLRAGHGQQGGAWDGSAGGANPVPPPSLGAVLGRAARGEREA